MTSDHVIEGAYNTFGDSICSNCGVVGEACPRCGTSCGLCAEPVCEVCDECEQCCGELAECYDLEDGVASTGKAIWVGQRCLEGGVQYRRRGS